MTYLKPASIFASLVTASVVVPDQQVLIQSNAHLHQDLLPLTSEVFDHGCMMDLIARVTSSGIVVLLLVLARRFGSAQDEDRAMKLEKPSQEELRPFWWAVEMGDVELLSSILVSDPALAHRSNEEGRTALHVAAFNGASDSLKLLLRFVTDVNTLDAYGETAVHLAAGAGHLCSLIILLDAGANHDQKNSAGCTALGKAMAAGETAACELLVEHSGVQLALE